jgi:hypothetical protein
MRPSWEEIEQLRSIISMASGIAKPLHVAVSYKQGSGSTMKLKTPDGWVSGFLPAFVDDVPIGPDREAQLMLIYMGLAKPSQRLAEFADYAALAWEFGKNHAQALGTLPGDS